MEKQYEMKACTLTLSLTCFGFSSIHIHIVFYTSTNAAHNRKQAKRARYSGRSSRRPETELNLTKRKC